MIERISVQDKLSDVSEDQSSSSWADDQISIVTSCSTAGQPVLFQHSSDYMIEATEIFNEAVQLEVNERYEEALARYKLGIDVLITAIRIESDEAKQRKAKEKMDKYLTRSDNIYKYFVKPATTSPITDELANAKPKSVGTTIELKTRELPLAQLAKYKVVRVLDDNVMSVQEVTTRRFYIIKAIDRTDEWSQNTAGDLSYMVHLVAYFVGEYVVFLLLQPARYLSKESLQGHPIIFRSLSFAVEGVCWTIFPRTNQMIIPSLPWSMLVNIIRKWLLIWSS